VSAIVCQENLPKEEATKASGILPIVDGCVPIACSGDAGWQGNGSHCMYNSQSGLTTLCDGQTKKGGCISMFLKTLLYM